MTRYGAVPITGMSTIMLAMLSTYYVLGDQSIQYTINRKVKVSRLEVMFYVYESLTIADLAHPHAVASFASASTTAGCLLKEKADDDMEHPCHRPSSS